MARSFTAASSHKLVYASAAAVTSYPLTYAAWVKPTSGAVASSNMFSIISIGDVGSTDPINLLAMQNTGFLAMWARNGALNNFGQHGTRLTAAWHHVAGWINSSGHSKPYRNGNAGTLASGTTGSMASGVDNTTVGVLKRTGESDFWDGSIAEAAIWNVQLTDNEILALARGMSPARVRPQSLKAYWPLYGNTSPEVDFSGSKANLTVTSATQANHAPLVMPPYAGLIGWNGAFTAGGAAPPVAVGPTQGPFRGPIPYILRG